ncbi:MAG: Gfo/Idh/MocA family oxidoreductase [Bacteroidales bacterium]|nr:Gfo/Idh/MocA family oxidoreductase [Bacteroidales bacterium]MDY6000964.1 Gfo/Idh/MocA family oxidoreductase [Candidatus Cryptobacteroides sp.]
MLDVPVRLAAIGLGNRTTKYLNYLLDHPQQGRLTAIVEPDPSRMSEIKSLFGVESGNCFSSTESFFCEKRDVDGVIIGTPDKTHYGIAMDAIGHGYHCLLEKPIATTARECIEVAEAAKKAGVLVCVCYVLRYHPYYHKVKDILDSGELGPIISGSHIENVGIDRMTHSYVRGIFSNSNKSTPLILEKCCHDIDMLIWLMNKHVAKVSSFGSLGWFKSENAPEGSSERCVNCKIEQDCPFSAVDLYQRRKEWISNFVVPNGDTLDNVIAKELREGRYGRCVYHCDNDVADHQTVGLEMAGGVTIGMSIETLTRHDGRATKINCAFGEVFAGGDSVTVTHFSRSREEKYSFAETLNMPLHGNADLKIIEDFLQAVQDPENHKLLSPIEEALESHIVCFKIEESRQEGKTIEL